ncbi:hypothetical protein Y032_0421g1176 [Ancylostoma ceylanicum]|uniref:Major facilitator superfamily (MFS) profile domain-containing protein n=1 Tax=Ancylostoma ceylanicum TaxID=53326 RepID=A0A016X333_9BILA|nr:hypothetical protein Y032_0421g1176 [Ancylostoma ceylanicum]
MDKVNEETLDVSEIITNVAWRSIGIVSTSAITRTGKSPLNEDSLRKESILEAETRDKGSIGDRGGARGTTYEDVPRKKEEEKRDSEMNSKILLNMSILICINLLNYMDRFTIAGVLTNIQAYFGISDAEGGLLQSVFIVFYMFCSPVCGFLGDRYNRKWIMVVGITIWIAAVFASTFIPPQSFLMFLLFRGIVGIGEASYVTISPTMIADMFTGRNRSRMLMLFYFAIPFGSGLGFIVGSRVAALTGRWEWGVRVSVIFGVICLAMIILFIEDPERGAAEREKGEMATTLVASSYMEDIKALLTNPSYVLATCGFTAIVFTVGTLSWWMPTTIEHSIADSLGLNSTSMLDSHVKAQTNLIFGVITCFGGIVGVALGSTLSMMLRSGYGPFKCVQTSRSDPIICGVGALIGVPAMYFSLHFIPINMIVAWELEQRVICVSILEMGGVRVPFNRCIVSVQLPSTCYFAAIQLLPEHRSAIE